MNNAQQLADLQQLGEVLLPMLLAWFVDARRRKDAKRIKELEQREDALTKDAARLVAKEHEREATVNRMRTAIWKSRLGTDGKLDEAKNTPEKVAVQVCLDTLRASLWPRGDEKRGDG